MSAFPASALWPHLPAHWCGLTPQRKPSQETQHGGLRSWRSCRTTLVHRGSWGSRSPAASRGAWERDRTPSVTAPPRSGEEAADAPGPSGQCHTASPVGPLGARSDQAPRGSELSSWECPNRALPRDGKVLVRVSSCLGSILGSLGLIEGVHLPFSLLLHLNEEGRLAARFYGNVLSHV